MTGISGLFIKNSLKKIYLFGARELFCTYLKLYSDDTVPPATAFIPKNTKIKSFFPNPFISKSLKINSDK